MKYAAKPTDIYVISPQYVPDKLKKKKRKKYMKKMIPKFKVLLKPKLDSKNKI